MKKFVSIYLALSFMAFAVFATGCANSAQGDIDVAVQTHRNATSPSETANACRNVFIKARRYSNRKDLCEELVKRKDADLVVCEDEINSPEFYDLIQYCKQPLSERIRKIKKLKNAGVSTTADQINFKIPFQIQFRDLSDGYVAVTGDTSNKQVILSFDDGPHPLNSPQVIQMLEKCGVKAHFFELGSSVRKYPNVTKMIASKGHSIGNHSWDHEDFSTLSYDQQIKQMVDTHQILMQTLGWVDPFFRYPYGAKTPLMNQFLKDHQVANFLWSIDSNDWRKINADGTLRTNAQVISETLAQLDQRGRGMVLFHDIHDRTIELLPEFLAKLHQRGYTVVMLQPSNKSLRTALRLN